MVKKFLTLTVVLGQRAQKLRDFVAQTVADNQTQVITMDSKVTKEASATLKYNLERAPTHVKTQSSHEKVVCSGRLVLNRN